MDKVVPKGYMQDALGRLVPEECVKDVDKLRNDLVKEIVSKATDLSKLLADFKTKAMADIQAFVALSAEKYNIKLGGQKGNLSLHSFDGSYRIIVAIAETLVFDERLQAAKDIIAECAMEWTGNRPEAVALFNSAFNVDRSGRVNTKRILALRRLDIKDSRWIKAMELISDSLAVAGSKEYIRIYKRDIKGDYKQVNLDITAI